MKHGNEYYTEQSRLIFNVEPYKSLSRNAKWLYIVLKELEQRFTNDDRDHFGRTNEDLADDAEMSLKTLKQAKAELLKTDLIETWQTHYIGKDGKLSEKHVTAYRLRRTHSQGVDGIC